MERRIFYWVPVAAGLLLAGCGKSPEQQGGMPTLELPVASPVVKKVTDWDEYTGRIEAIETVEVRSRVSGYLTEVGFKDGEYVEKGRLLFVIDPRPYEADLKRAEGELERAKSQYQLAKLEFDRAESLRTKRVISSEEYDSKTSNLNQARAAIQSSEAALDTAKLNLEFCRITAPISGRVSRAQVTLGNLIQPTQQILTTIVSQDPMYVYFNADENALLRYQRLHGADIMSDGGIPVEMALPDESGYPHEGKLDFVDNRVESGTGTIRMRGIFDNKDQRLTAGLFARVRVPASSEYEAKLIPDSAIGNDQGQKFVLVVDDQNTVQYRPVQVGALHDGLRGVVSGLEAGERIALSGLMMARPGTPITPKPTEIQPTNGGEK